MTGGRARAAQSLSNVRVLAVALVGAVFLMYWRTTGPTVLPGDSGELQFAAWGFWLAHPTGYPLYLILGGAWQHLVQIGDPAFRLNLFSAFWSALTTGVAFLAFWNVTQSRAAATIAALTLAVSPLFWSQATRAEVYALHSFFVALLTLWGILWHTAPQRKYAIAFALTFGLSLAHHRTTLLLLPAFAALFADRLIVPGLEVRRLIQRVFFYGALAALPLLLYLYIPLRAGATPYAQLDLSPAPPITIFEDSPRGWLAVILGSGFAGALRVDAGTWNVLRDFPNHWLTQLNPVGVLASVLGFGALLWLKKYPLAAFVLYGGLTFLLFNSVYQIGDIADYYTPIYFFCCLALAAAIAVVIQQLRANPYTRHSTLPSIALLAFLAVLPLQNLFNNFFTQDRSHYTMTRTQWAGIFASDLPDNAILISNDRDEITPLYFLQLVEKQHPNWAGVFPKIAPGARYDNVIALAQTVMASKRPLYAIKQLPALTLRYSIQEIGPDLWRVNRAAPRAPQNPSDAILGNALRVRGYSILAGEPTAGSRLTLTVQYEVLEPLTRDYTTSLQLLDANDKKVSQGNDHIPGELEYPSSKWRAGEIIQDQFEIELDPNLEAAKYQVMLRVYDPSSGDAVGELTRIGEIEISE